MINSYDDLSPVQLDVLKEIGNIGSGNAATALFSLGKRDWKCFSRFSSSDVYSIFSCFFFFMIRP